MQEHKASPALSQASSDAETRRLQALYELGVLDSPREVEFDALTKTASLALDAPIALISLVDANRLWFKASEGIHATTVDRETAFCSQTVQLGRTYQVEDALLDGRFSKNLLVAGDAAVRYYAGSPITLSNGEHVGAICVLDRTPRKLTETQQEVLESLAIAVSKLLELRHARHLDAALQQAKALKATLDTHAIVTEADSDGTITNCNGQFERISGYTREELIGQNHRIVNSGNHSTAFWSEMWSKISSGQPWRGEICNRTKSGELYWVDSMIVPFKGRDGFVERYVSIRIDITQRIRNQAELKQMSSRLNLAIEGGNDGLWDWPDLRQDEQWWSPSYYTMLGYTEHELPPSRKSLLSILHPNSRTALRRRVRQAIVGKEQLDFEVELKTKNRGFRWFRIRAKTGRDEENHLTRMAGSTQDVHDKKTAETALLATNELLEKSQAVAKVGGWELNLVTGAMFWTDETYKILETSPSELDLTLDTGIGFFLPESKRIASDAMDAAVTRGQEFDLELQTYTHKGNQIDVRITCAITKEATKLVKLSGIVQDITQRKRHERDLRTARDEAQTASRSKGQFLANMSHEIRTPMNAILGLLDLLQRTELTDRQRDYVDKTEGAARSLLGLLNDILDFSKVEAGKMALESEPVNIEKLLQNVATILSAYVGTKPLEVLFDIDPTLPSVVISDAIRLQQILINLGGNAVKFTTTGHVILEMKVIEQTNNSASIKFTIKDTGIGIAQEHQEHIFTGFSQAEGSTTRRFGGTGLGLAISKRLVELMGGTLTLESKLGVGSTFTFTLPMQLGESKEIDESASLEGTHSTEILIVDDYTESSDITCRIVQHWGWQATVVASGEDAINSVNEKISLESTSFPYCIVIVNSTLPGIDGWETVQSLRKISETHKTKPPIVIMANSLGKEVVSLRGVQKQEARSSFIVKPFTPRALLQAIFDAKAGVAAIRKNTAHKVSQRRLNGMKILVVDDNLINQQVASELLRAEGANVALASNGQIAVEMIKSAIPQFHVVLMDIQMPVLDGYGATKIVRETLGFSDLPIIAMTANAMASDREACLSAGMNEHIGKPFEMAKLLSLLLRMTGFNSDNTLSDVNASENKASKQVPEIPGLDLRTAIERMSGSESLYIRAAQTFIDSIPNLLTHLRLDNVSGDKKSLKIHLHTLKGNAGTLGAKDLSRVAAELEKTSSEVTGAALQPVDILHLETYLHAARDQLIMAVDALTAASSDAAPSPEGHGEGKPTRSAFDAIRRINALAINSDLEVLVEFSQSRNDLSDLPRKDIEALESALQSLSLESACEICQKILNEQGATAYFGTYISN